MTGLESMGPVDHLPEAITIDWLIESDIDGLLDAPERVAKATSNDRLERAFLEVVEFRRAQGRTPSSATRDIAERKLGARLDGILADEAKSEALKPLDEFSMLAAPMTPTSIDELLEGDELDLLGDDEGLLDLSGLPRQKRVEPDVVAQRIKSQDFDQFKDLFVQKHAEIKEGVSKLVSFEAAGGQKAIKEGRFFVLSGVMLFVAEITEPQAATGVRTRYKRRTRTIFENGTESSLYRRSLAGQLFEHGGLAIVPSSFDEVLAEDEASGYIYVLRSLSDDPKIKEIGDLHKIGFSRGPVEKRIANAEHQPTYLMAPVEIVASYKTYNLKASALEHLLHRVFAEVRLDLVQIDQKGREYVPSEWFDVPRKVIDQAINMIITGVIVDYEYDRQRQVLVKRLGGDGSSQTGAHF